MMTRFLEFFILVAISLVLRVNCSIEEEEHGVIYANNCEACKILATELQERLTETGRSRDVIETGLVLDRIIVSFKTYFDLLIFFFALTGTRWMM